MSSSFEVNQESCLPSFYLHGVLAPIEGVGNVDPGYLWNVTLSRKLLDNI